MKLIAVAALSGLVGLGGTVPPEPIFDVQLAGSRYVMDRQGGHLVTAVLDTFDAPVFSRNPSHAAAIASLFRIPIATRDQRVRCHPESRSCEPLNTAVIRISNPTIVNRRAAQMDVQLFDNHATQRGSVALPSTWHLTVVRGNSGWTVVGAMLSVF